MSNSLAAVHPELVAEWSEKNLPLTPDSISFGSNKKVWWKDNMDIFDFALTDEEMEQIAKLDKNERYYHRTDEQLIQFANWKPEFEK